MDPAILGHAELQQWCGSGGVPDFRQRSAEAAGVQQLIWPRWKSCALCKRCFWVWIKICLVHLAEETTLVHSILWWLSVTQYTDFQMPSWLSKLWINLNMHFIHYKLILGSEFTRKPHSSWSVMCQQQIISAFLQGNGFCPQHGVFL